MRLIKDLTGIDEIVDKEFSLLLVKSNNCSVCVAIQQQLELLLKRYEDKITLNIIYNDEVSEFRGKFLVFSVPTVLIFSNGKEIFREARFINFQKIDKLIDMYLN